MILIYSFSSLIIWQHIARVYNLKYRPSYFLERGADLCIYFWTKLGELFARLSSYIHYLRLEELAISTRELIEPLWNSLTSFVYFLKGYMNFLNKVPYKTSLYIGSVSIITGLVGVGYCSTSFGVEVNSNNTV